MSFVFILQTQTFLYMSRLEIRRFARRNGNRDKFIFDVFVRFSCRFCRPFGHLPWTFMKTYLFINLESFNVLSLRWKIVTIRCEDVEREREKIYNVSLFSFSRIRTFNSKSYRSSIQWQWMSVHEPLVFILIIRIAHELLTIFSWGVSFVQHRHSSSICMSIDSCRKTSCGLFFSWKIRCIKWNAMTNISSRNYVIRSRWLSIGNYFLVFFCVLMKRKINDQ